MSNKENNEYEFDPRMKEVFEKINQVLFDCGFNERVDEIRLVSIEDDDKYLEEMENKKRGCGQCCRTRNGVRTCVRCCYS